MFLGLQIAGLFEAEIRVQLIGRDNVSTEILQSEMLPKSNLFSKR
jgi:hypothetical protein